MAVALRSTARPLMRTPLTAACGAGWEFATTINCAELVDMADSHIVFARLNETSEMLDLSIHLAGGQSPSSRSDSPSRRA